MWLISDKFEAFQNLTSRAKRYNREIREIKQILIIHLSLVFNPAMAGANRPNLVLYEHFDSACDALSRVVCKPATRGPIGHESADKMGLARLWRGYEIASTRQGT